MVKEFKATPFDADSKFIEVNGTTLRWDPREITNPLLGSVHDPIYQGSKKDLAVTGEISLRGHIKPVGGIFEKIYGARRKGIKLVTVPKDNEKQIPTGLKDIEVKAISNIEELIQIALEQ